MGRQRMTLATLLDRIEQRPTLIELPADALLSMEETAAYLGLSPSTLEKWVSGERWVSVGIPAYHRLHGGPKSPIRFMVSDLQEWLRHCRASLESGETPAHCA